MPRWATGAAGAKRPSNPLAAARDRAPTGFSASARDGPGREHTNNHHWARSVPKRKRKRPGGPTSTRIPRTIEVFERKLHPRPLGQGYTCLGATPDAAPPPRVCCPTAGGAGGSSGRADWSPLPPPWRGWLKTLCPKGTSARRVVAPPPPGPPAGSGSRVRGPWL
ncbi:hypothetical protein H6P81_021219 [Aristolochia fimbriata]|uniref:Uncharacterized protein n=1 Tax=Aristolochia fimbriata TaxID=158543 RepID=A0AAV7DQI6_ARIFI|nr:hypothetical protein H6P81_021219 [Aristolochia fimbriata]